VKKVALLFNLLILACASNKGSGGVNRDQAYLRSLENRNLGCPQLNDGIKEVSNDPEYAFKSQKPVKVSGGPENERAYLNMLIGPNGKQITGYYRVGSFGGDEAILDMYKLIIEGDTLENVIYLDMYNCDNPKAPKGFGIK
jgi:hypothetical protein